MRKKIETIFFVTAPTLVLLFATWMMSLTNDAPTSSFVLVAAIGVVLILFLSYINKKQPQKTPLVSNFFIFISALGAVLLIGAPTREEVIFGLIMMGMVTILGLITYLKY